MRIDYNFLPFILIVFFIHVVSVTTEGAELKCGTSKNIGLRQVTLSTGRTATVWYPSSRKATAYRYFGGYRTTAALNAPYGQCSRPLVVFSHGLFGCGLQSIYLTESLAKAGYIVIAPNHADNNCDLDLNLPPAQAPVANPAVWTSQTYFDRKQDLDAAVAYFTAATQAKAVNSEKIAIAGHSLGGYSAIGMIGGWEEWATSKFKAALLYSPYLMPYQLNDRLPELNAPVMYQTGGLDFGIAPFVNPPSGAYTYTRSPKYLVDLRAAGHFAWTNLQCGKYQNTASCLAQSQKARLIVNYSVAFLDKYLKNSEAPLLGRKAAGLRAYVRDLN